MCRLPSATTLRLSIQKHCDKLAYCPAKPEQCKPIAPMQTAYITHPECQLHEMGRHHPESPERLRAIQDQLIASGLLGLLSEHEAPAANREQLIRVHDATYVDEIEGAAPRSGIVHLDPDTAMNAHSYRAALHAA